MSHFASFHPFIPLVHNILVQMADIILGKISNLTLQEDEHPYRVFHCPEVVGLHPWLHTTGRERGSRWRKGTLSLLPLMSAGSAYHYENHEPWVFPRPPQVTGVDFVHPPARDFYLSVSQNKQYQYGAGFSLCVSEPLSVMSCSTGEGAGCGKCTFGKSGNNMDWRRGTSSLPFKVHIVNGCGINQKEA